MRCPLGQLGEMASAWRLRWSMPDQHHLLMVISGEAGRVRLTYRAGAGGFVETSLDRAPVEEIAGGLPVREFRSYKGRRHYSGWYWAATMERLVAYESRLELARILLADFDPAVRAIAAQPFQMVGADGARQRRHVPDLLLVGGDGQVTVVDVKAAHRRDNPQVRALMEWTRRVVALRGWGFEEWYGASRVRLDNVRFLAGYRRRSTIDADVIPLVLDAVRDGAGDGASIAEVTRSVTAVDTNVPVAVTRPVILHLLWSGELECDLARPLGTATVVWPGGRRDSGGSGPGRPGAGPARPFERCSEVAR